MNKQRASIPSRVFCRAVWFLVNAFVATVIVFLFQVEKKHFLLIPLAFDILMVFTLGETAAKHICQLATVDRDTQLPISVWKKAVREVFIGAMLYVIHQPLDIAIPLVAMCYGEFFYDIIFETTVIDIYS